MEHYYNSTYILNCNFYFWKLPIRYYLPKTTYFEHITKEQVKFMEDNINNIPRDIFGGKTPYELTNELYPELIEKLNSNYIKPDDVTLNKNDIFGGCNER